MRSAHWKLSIALSLPCPVQCKSCPSLTTRAIAITAALGCGFSARSGSRSKNSFVTDGDGIEAWSPISSPICHATVCGIAVRPFFGQSMDLYATLYSAGLPPSRWCASGRPSERHARRTEHHLLREGLESGSYEQQPCHADAREAQQGCVAEFHRHAHT